MLSPVAVKRNRESRGFGGVGLIDVQLYFESIPEMLAWLVDYHVSARHQKQPFVTLEEESAGISQYPLLLECEYTCCG